METLVLKDAQHVAGTILGIQDPMLDWCRSFSTKFVDSASENLCRMQQHNSRPPKEEPLAFSECAGQEWLHEMVCSNRAKPSDAEEAEEFEIHSKRQRQRHIGLTSTTGPSPANCEFLYEPLIEDELTSAACRYCMNLCALGLIAILAAQFLFLGAVDQKGIHDSSCLLASGFNSAVWIMGGCISLCLCAWTVYGMLCNRRKSCSCDQDMEISRSRAEDADKRAQRAQRSKQQFMTYVFHNIRVPFNAIVLGLGYLRAIGDRETSSDDVKDKMDLVKLMLDCAETMTNVLDDVTDLDQGEDGLMELHMEEFDLLAVVKFLIWGLKDLLYHKNICFKMDIEPMVENLLAAYHVIGDKHRVVQTLGIFLSNAVKFTPAGGRLDLEIKCEEVMESVSSDMHPQPYSKSPLSSHGFQRVSFSGFPLSCPAKDVNSELQVDVGVKHKVANVVLSVKDFATGISSQDQAKLFEPYSLATGWVPKSGLSGLGLSMAKRFAERVGGYIGLKVKEGEDSTFCLSIPYPLVPVQRHEEADLQVKEACKPDAANCKSVCMIQDDLDSPSHIESRIHRCRSIKLKSSFPLQGPGSRRRVLLVEDTEINRIILRKVLQNLNLHCEEAENGKVAVDYFKQGRTYDLVLMDKEMPIMDGHEATRQLRMMGVKTPIIALTGNALQSDKDLFFEAGVDDFQTKPLSRDKLVQLLARYGVESSCADNRRG